MKKDKSEQGSYERMDLVHILIGGGISFGITVLLIDIVQNLLQQILYNLGMAGVVFFIDYYQFARGLYVFGLVYLTSGFSGGLYTGYNVYINLKKTLFFPAVISTVGFILLATILANYPITPQFTGLMVLQFAGSLLGSYLGGYAINWTLLHEKQESPNKLTLEIHKESVKK
jgi:hypothetical protein